MWLFVLQQLLSGCLCAWGIFGCSKMPYPKSFGFTLSMGMTIDIINLFLIMSWSLLSFYCNKYHECFLIYFSFIVFSMSSIVDRFFYRNWTNVHYNFLEFNVFYNLSAFYGSHPWHWYLSQGFAVILGTHVFPFLMGLRKGMQPVYILVIFWTIFIYR